MTTQSTLTVRKVESSRDFNAFFEFPWTVYKDDPNWVPPLLSQRRHLLDRSKNPSFEYLDADYYVAWRGDKPVGTIAAFINHRHDEYHPEDNRLGWFGFFECLDDPDAARALLSTALDYARARNCSAVRGPANFTLNDECALLVENFEPPVILMPYNPPYYQRLIEDSGLGYSKIMDTVSVLAEPSKYLDENGNLTPKLVRMMELLKTRGGIGSRLADTKRLDEEMKLLRELYSSAWEKNWGFVPPTERELDELFKNLKQYFYPGLGIFGQMGGKDVGFILGLPDMNQVLRQAYARPGTPEIWTLLKALWHWKIRPKITRQRILLFGIQEPYRGKGVDGAILAEYLKQSMMSYPVVDAGWILETNARAINEMYRFDARIYKRYRFYQAPLG
ncbi:MAG: GNAT family N-acetyltransferase [Anaerolineae bacterium]|nr:GNAT family N-acetyltransferase [Anaerolineae bacterium]